MVCCDDKARHARRVFYALAANLDEITTRNLIGTRYGKLLRKKGAVLTDLNCYRTAAG